MGYEYLDALAAELGDGYRIANFQQRGLSPSTIDGPFTMATALDDVAAVLETLGWPQAVVVGHSWGGHLALRFAAAHPDRLLGLLCIDPVGVVGDGGAGATFAELAARTPSEGRARLHELARQKPSGGEEVPEALRILWPAYFADPRAAPPLAVSRMREDVNGALMAQLLDGLEPTAAALPRCEAPSANSFRTAR
jgi:pimeloyl-ACP methyl ester carboxylesterase